MHPSYQFPSTQCMYLMGGDPTVPLPSCFAYVIWVVVKIMVPFVGTLNSRCRIIIGIRKGTIILTTTHVICYIVLAPRCCMISFIHFLGGSWQAKPPHVQPDSSQTKKGHHFERWAYQNLRIIPESIFLDPLRYLLQSLKTSKNPQIRPT